MNNLAKLYFRGLRLYPVQTFFKRFFYMNKFVIKRFLYQIFSILGIAGAKSLNKEDLRKIQLRNNCKLGKKGQKLLVPFDTAIFKTVTRFGYWEKIESDFLVKNSLLTKFQIICPCFVPRMVKLSLFCFTKIFLIGFLK